MKLNIKNDETLNSFDNPIDAIKKVVEKPIDNEANEANKANEADKLAIKESDSFENPEIFEKDGKKIVWLAKSPICYKGKIYEKGDKFPYFSKELPLEEKEVG